MKAAQMNGTAAGKYLPAGASMMTVQCSRIIMLAPAGKYIPAAVPFICAAFIVLLYRYFFAREKD